MSSVRRAPPSMALRVDKLPEARLDLIEIWNYISEDNPDAADRVLNGIQEALNRLAEYPELGRARPELRKNLRSFVSGNYVLFYTPKRGVIEVVRVIRAERDIDAVFGDTE